MFDTLIASIESTFVQFSLRRLLYIIFLFAVVLLALYIYDSSTEYSFYTRIDKRISALERLSELEHKGISSSSTLDSLYRGVVNELYRGRSSGSMFHLDWAPLMTFLSATFVGLILAIMGLVQIINRDPNGKNVFGGSLVFVTVLGIPAIVVPHWAPLWAMAGTYALVQFVALKILTKLFPSEKQLPA
jgi:hypothetical protein